MSQNSVVLRTFDNYITAEIIKGRLAEDGIMASIKDEHTVTMNWMWSQALGGIKLLVDANEYERANELLTSYEEAFEAKQDAPAYDEPYDEQLDPNNRVCIHCGSKNTKLQTINKTWAYSTLLFLGFPIKVKEDKWHCFHCGADF